MKQLFLASGLLAVLLAPVIAGAATLEVSQPVQVTNDNYYERGQAITFDGTDYWLIYGRSASVTGSYATGNPDINDYGIHFKKATSVPGLVGATASAIAGATNSYMGESGATYFGSEVWAFATIDEGTQADVYGWYTTDGTTWTQVTDMVTGLSTGAAHHDEIAFNSELYIMVRRGDDFYTTHSATPKTGGWSTEVAVGSAGGLAHFFLDGSTLYLAVLKSPAPRENQIFQYNPGTDSWSLVDSGASAGWDPTLFKVGGTYVFAQAPWSGDGGGRQWIIEWSNGTLDGTFFDGTSQMMSEGRYGSNTWIEMWPIGFTDNSGDSYLFCTSERNPNDPGSEITGNIWYLEVDWDVTREHHTYVQEAIGAAGAGDEIDVAAGTYSENLSISSGMTLNGAQAGIDARGRSASETVITSSSGNMIYTNTGDVTIDGFQLTGAGAGKLVFVDSGHNLVFRNNILDGTVGDALYFGSTSSDPTVHQNVFDGPGFSGYALFFDGGSDHYDNLAITDNNILNSDMFAGAKTFNTSGMTMSGNLLDGGDANLSSAFANSTIDGNTFRNNSYTNMQVGLLNGTISNNIFECAGPSPGAGYPSSAMMLWGDQYGLAPSQNVDLENNTFYYNEIAIPDEIANGLRILSGIDPTTIHASGNSFVDGGAQTGAYAVLNQATGTADASANWWGTNVASEIPGKSDGAVDYTPWLDVGTDTDPGAIGFQGDFSVLNVDDDSPQTGTTCRVQEGVDLVTGSTVNLANGTYTGAVAINDMNLTLHGASETGVIVQAATSQTGSANTFTISASGYDVTFEYMTIRYGDYGIRSSAGNIDVLHCTIYHNGWDGTPYPTGGALTQASAGAHYATYATDGGAVRIENSTGSEIAHNTVYENDRGLRYQYGSNGNFHHNTSHTNIQSGMYLTDHGAPGGCTNTQVHDNTVYGNMNNGILALRGNGNTITDNDVYDNWNTGIHMHGPSDFMVAGNTVSNNSLYDFTGEGTLGNSDGGIAAAGAETMPATSYTLGVVGNTLSNNNAGSHANATGIWLGSGLPADGMDIENNAFAGHEIDVHVLSQAATTTVNWNSFNGTVFGVKNDDGTKALLDAENCWWGDATGPTHSGNPGGIGAPSSDDVDYDPWIGKAGSENLVCVPDPQEISAADDIGGSIYRDDVVIHYLGGASAPVYGYSIDVQWDVSKATLFAATKPDTGPFAGAALFQVVNMGTGHVRIDAALGGADPGTPGPDDLCKLTFQAVGCGQTAVTLTINRMRDSNNDDISGVYDDDGLLKVDTATPTVTAAQITRQNLPETGYTKDGDDLDLTATIGDGCGNLADLTVTADLSDLLESGGTTVAPTSFDTGTGLATWDLNAVDLATPDALKTVTITATDLLLNQGTANTSTYADNTKPALISGFSAEPGHNKAELSWTNPTGDPNLDNYGVMIRRTDWDGTSPPAQDDYPEYTGSAPTYPDSADGTRAYWQPGMIASYTNTFAADGSERDIYYYQAFVFDKAYNYGLADAGARDRTTNYWLGDVRPTVYDGQVETADISALGATYYVAPGGPTWDNECDVGPTDDNSRTGIPGPDNSVDFEDMMIFSMNYGVVTPLMQPPYGVPDVPTSGRIGLALELPADLAVGSEFTVSVVLQDDDGIVQGTHFVVDYDADVLEYLGASAGALLSGIEDLFFMPMLVEGQPDLSIAALGHGATFGHSGELVRLRFRCTGEGPIALELQDVIARNVLNENLLVPTSDIVSGPEGIMAIIPTQVYLRGNQPNPFTGATTIAFGLPQEGLVRLAIYDVSGRMVRMLINGTLPAAEHVLSWDRRDDSGHAVSGGVYLYRLQTSEKTITRKMVVGN
jgi:parallel beta-helix repeat protein